MGASREWLEKEKRLMRGEDRIFRDNLNPLYSHLTYYFLALKGIGSQVSFRIYDYIHEAKRGQGRR